MRIPLNEIKEKVKELLLDDVLLSPVARYTAWERAGGGARAALCADAREILPEAKTVFVLVKRVSFGQSLPGKCMIDPYYTLQDELHLPTEAFCQWLRSRGARAELGDKIPLKCAAVAAEGGMRGKNDLFCHPEYGPAVKLSAVIADVSFDLPAEIPPERDCAACGACAAACPVGALNSGHVDVSRCLRSYMLNGYVPEELRKPMGMRLVGCDACRAACPQCAQTPRVLREDCLWEVEALLRCEKPVLEALQALIGRNYARKGRIRAQAAICAGNSAEKKYGPALAELLRCEYAPARAHAAWALAQLGAREYIGEISAALATEKEAFAREDLRKALESLQ